MSRAALWTTMCVWILMLSSAARGAQVWEQKAEVPTPRLEASAVRVGDQFFLVGGFLEASGATDLVQIYDLTDGKWKEGTPLPDKLHHVGVESYGDEIYVLGGMDNKWKQKKSFYIFNTKTNQWTQGPDLPQAMAAFAHVILNKKIYVLALFSPSPFPKLPNL